MNDIKLISAQMSVGGLNAFSSLCPASADENRKQTCQKLASNLMDSSRDLMGLSVALKVGERVGLTQPQLEAKRADYEKIQGVMPSSSMLSTTNAFSGCENSIPVIKFLDQSVSQGEIAALRATLPAEQK